MNKILKLNILNFFKQNIANENEDQIKVQNVVDDLMDLCINLYVYVLKKLLFNEVKRMESTDQLNQLLIVKINLYFQLFNYWLKYTNKNNEIFHFV